MNASSALGREPRARTSALWYATLILIPVVTAAVLFWVRQTEVKQLAARPISSYGALPEFQLTNQDGESFGSAQLHGKIWIASFIFTSCPGPCPIISSRMAELQKPLEKTDVRLVSFTVDPATDTPPVLRAYADKLKAQTQRWAFLTGPAETLYDLSRNGFKLAVDEGGEATGPVHSTRVVLVDRRGIIRGYHEITAPDGVTKLLADTSHLLREQPR